MNEPPFAEYPRLGLGPSLGRGPGVYFEAIGEAWEVVRKDLGTWVAATIVYFVVTYAVTLPVVPFYLSAIAGLQSGPSGTDFAKLGVSYFALCVLSFVAQGFLLTGMVGLGVRKLRGEYVNVGMIFEPFRHFGRMLGACLLNGLIVSASFAACFLPSLFFYPVLILMPSVAFLRNLGPMEALSLTFDVCKRHWMSLFALLLVLWIMVFVAFTLCIVPGLVAFPILTVVLAIHYRAFFESSAPVPTI